MRRSRGSAEADLLERKALEQWRALKPPTLAGNPPTLQGIGTEAVETLGKLMNNDKNLSVNKNQACSFCHMPYVGFGGPIPSVNLTMVANPGSAHFRAGKRTPQRYTYSPFFPVLQYNRVQGNFFGGNFFDSRSTGVLTRNPDAQQAQHPPLDSQEMGIPGYGVCRVPALSGRVQASVRGGMGQGVIRHPFSARDRANLRNPRGSRIAWRECDARSAQRRGAHAGKHGLRSLGSVPRCL